jgi:hypothetical protein
VIRPSSIATAPGLSTRDPATTRGADTTSGALAPRFIA